MAQASLPRSSPVSLSVGARNGIDGESQATGETPELDNGTAIDLDARILARSCLLEVGKEMGVWR
jgi:hypothetical protein